jgi:O-antigen/teichoic acid export membrane protein
LLNVSQAIANALSPQIIKTEGEGNREKMLYLASIECKYAYMMLVMVAIPLIFNMHFILELWLRNVPQNSVMFCNMVIIAAMCDTVTGGLGIANQAIGKIKVYSLIFGSIKLLTLPIAYMAVRIVRDPLYAMIPFVAVELASAVFRMFYLKSTAGLRISAFLKNVILPAVCSTCAVAGICFILDACISWDFKIIILIPSAVAVVALVAYCTMDSEEKELVKRICRR